VTDNEPASIICTAHISQESTCLLTSERIILHKCETLVSHSNVHKDCSSAICHVPW